MNNISQGNQSAFVSDAVVISFLMLFNRKSDLRTLSRGDYADHIPLFTQEANIFDNTSQQYRLFQPRELVG